MAAFRYEAVDARGKSRRGLHRRGDRAAGARPAARRGPVPDGDRRPRTTRDARRRSIARGCPRRRCRSSTRQLATLARSGMPLDQALVRRRRAGRRRARRRSSSPACARRSRRASRSPARLRAGRGRSPTSIAASSPSAPRPGSCRTCSRASPIISRRREALRQKFTLALIYPALVTVIALAVIAVLLVYVVPQVVSVYQQSRQTLPWLTQALIAVSAFFRATGWYLARRRSSLAVVGVRARQSPRRVPRALARGAAARAGRRPAGRGDRHGALREHARDPHGKRRAAAALARCRARRRVVAAAARTPPAAAARLVREGVSLARALKEQRVFPPVLIHLVANGEASGQLAPMLERAAALLEQRIRAAHHLVRGAGAAGADRRDGRDRARAGARDHAADRLDEPADPLSGMPRWPRRCSSTSSSARWAWRTSSMVAGRRGSSPSSPASRSASTRISSTIGSARRVGAGLAAAPFDHRQATGASTSAVGRYQHGNDARSGVIAGPFRRR